MKTGSIPFGLQLRRIVRRTPIVSSHALKEQGDRPGGGTTASKLGTCTRL